MLPGPWSALHWSDSLSPGRAVTTPRVSSLHTRHTPLSAGFTPGQLPGPRPYGNCHQNTEQICFTFHSILEPHVSVSAPRFVRMEEGHWMRKICLSTIHFVHTIWFNEKKLNNKRKVNNLHCVLISSVIVVLWGVFKYFPHIEFTGPNILSPSRPQPPIVRRVCQ